MKKIAVNIFGRRIKAATCKSTSMKTKHLKNSEILSIFYGQRFSFLCYYIYIYIYIYYNMKVDIACILKINIYIPIKKFTQNKYSKKNVLL